MNEFQATLAAFLAGRAEFAQLDAALLRSLQADPSIGPAAYAAIDDLRRGGRLPLQLFVVLKNRIARSHAAAGQRPVPPPRQELQPAPPPQEPPPMPRSEPVSAPSFGSGAVGSAPEPGGDRTVFGAQRPRHATGSSGPTSSSHPSVAQGVSPAAGDADARPTAPPAPEGRATGPSQQLAAPVSAERTIMGARPPPPTAGVSQPHSVRPVDPSIPAPITGGFDPTPTGGPDTGRTGAPFTARTGTGPTGGTGTAGSGWSDPAKWADQPSIALERGAVLKGRFVLENVVGRGGMGVVFRAKDLRKEEAQDRDPYVAIKILNDEFRRHPESLKALQREARKSQALAHPNIVNVFDFDRDGATVYMTMEFLEGESLDRIIKNPQFEGFALDEAYPLVDGLGQALRYAHNKQIVHSDFKPGNCFLTKNGVIKVFDFGIAQAAKLQGAQHGEVTRFDPGTLGALTPAYASCEMIDGEAPDPRDDIYAFGCVIYELLTGKHPFNKKSAAEAREQKLAPLPIKTLTRRQWRALQKSLAFRRADRSANIDELLSGLAKQPFNFARLAVGVAALLIVAAVGYFGLLQWQAQQTQSLIEDLASADDARVPVALERLSTRDENERETILRQVFEPLFAWYRGRVSRVVDVDNGLYDFPQALSIVGEAMAWYDDSARVKELRDQLEADRADLLVTLDGRYTAALQAGALLPDPNGDDVPELLALVGQVQPENKLLTGQDLVSARAVAYAERATAELGRSSPESLGSAGQLIELGLAAAPDHAGLRDLSDRLASRLGEAETARQIAEFQQALQPATNARTVAELRALATPAAGLERLRPTDASLNAYRQRLTSMLDAELTAAIGQRDWNGARGLVDGVAAFLSPEYLTRARGRITQASDAYDTNIETLVTALASAAEDGRMDVAQRALAQLTENGADEATRRQARNTIVNGYEDAVNRLARDRKFDEADTMLATALEFDAASERLRGLGDTINRQRDAAARADEAATAEQNAAQAAQLVANLTNALGRPDLSIADAERAVADAGKLEGVAAEHEYAGRRGRELIAKKLADQALALGGRDQWDAALRLLDDARGLVGGSASLEDARTDIVADREADREADRVRQGEQRLAQQQQNLEALVANPRYDAAWVAEVRELLAALRVALPENDSRLTQVGLAQQSAGEKLVDRAAEMRVAGRLDEADRMLSAALDFARGLPKLATEREALAVARAEADRVRERDRVAANIAQLKNTFETRVAARVPRDALARFEELKRLAPTDPYVTETGPRLLAGMYAQLAEPLKTTDFDTAQDLVDEGLKFWRDSPQLGTLIAEIRQARAAATAVPAPVPGPTVPATSGGTGAPPAVPVPNPTPPVTATPPRTQGCVAALAGAGGRGQAGRCFDSFGAGKRGPTLVVIPGAGGVATFAIGQTEVQVGKWAEYCESSGNCTALPDDPGYPATNLDAAAIEAYAAWLTQQTGATYRLPTPEEWLRAASGPRASQTAHNCIDGRGRGNRVRSVGDDNGNDWGVGDYFGNVRELVKTASGYELRGGSFRDQLNRCNAQRVDAYEGGGDVFTGFRLVRELGGPP